MAFMDDLKTDQRTQILVAGIVFFAIAFPVYFNYAASSIPKASFQRKKDYDAGTKAI